MKAFDHDAAQPQEGSKPLDPDVLPRAAFRLADLLDEMVALGPEGRAALREKSGLPNPFPEA